MAENPLLRVARLVGGVAMMQGRLGHQVLGQMLIAGTSELAVAGAAVAVAGTARVRNPAAQVVIRTAAPAIAIHALFDQRERMLRYRERALLQREILLARNDFWLERQNGALKRLNADLRKQCDLASDGHEAYAEALTRVRSENAILERHRAVLEGEKAVLEGEKTVLESENAILRHDHAALTRDKADLWKKCNLASDGHEAFAEALKRVRHEKAILKEDHALCVIDKSILQRRNETLRQELVAVTAKLRAALERKPENPEQ